MYYLFIYYLILFNFILLDRDRYFILVNREKDLL